MHRLIAMVVLLLLNVELPAAEQHNLDALKQAVTTFSEEQLVALGVDDFELSIGAIDSRLKLSDCGKKLTVSIASGKFLQGRVTTHVRCANSSAWQLYVPVHVILYRNVVVANQPMRRGDLIVPADLVMQRRDVSRMKQGYLLSVDDVVGKLVRFSVSAGVALHPRQLEAVKVVSRGARVRIESGTAAFRVQAEGKALKSGGLGERIPVKNLSSGQVVQAFVRGRDRVEIR